MARNKMTVQTVKPIRTIHAVHVVSQRSPKPFENSKRYKDMTELAENMMTMARVTPSVKASMVMMFAHQLLLIAHKQYRRTGK